VIDRTKVPVYKHTGTDVLWDGEIACYTWNWFPTSDVVLGLETLGLTIGEFTCQDLPCDDIVDLTDISPYNNLWHTITVACSDGSCAFGCSKYAYPAVVNCTNYNTFDNVHCYFLSCVTDSYWRFFGIYDLIIDGTLSMDTVCDSEADSCPLECNDGNKVPYPV